jgi:DNA-binding response OmpR family regulator
MNEPTTILFVDDEPGIRMTLPAILDGFQFKVSVAATVPEALHLIATQKFDVLISDLNIGQPGDGFTVVSAMRRTQPTAATFILTGYPAFESALEAIRQQVDDYLIKPADIQSLVERIRQSLSSPRSIRHFEPKRLAGILEDNKREIVRRWLARAHQDPQISVPKRSDRELTDHLPAAIEEIISRCRGNKLSDEAMKAAERHGRSRFKQGCSIPALIGEARILQETLSAIVQENLLAADVSFLIADVIKVGESIQSTVEASIRGYLHARHAASEDLSANKGKAVLLLSADRELSLLRAHVLSHAGFSTTRADSRQEALQLLNEKKFDALVVSYSMSGPDIVEMAHLFRAHNPNAPIIALTKGKWQDLKVDVDFAVTGEEGPEALIEAVDTALNRKQLRRIK